MTRKRCKRIQRREAAPTCVAYYLNPEVSTQERIAALAIKTEWASTSHFNVLADCRDMLILAASEKRDQQTMAVCDMAGIALMNMKDRHTKTGKIGATGDEIRALELLCDTSEDFWKRQPGSLFIDAEAALHRARQMRAEEASMREAA